MALKEKISHRKNGGMPGKRPSFFGEELRPLRVELPVDLVDDLHLLVARKRSRLNIELAAAIKQHLATDRRQKR
jgi:hypothetical protein